MRRLARLLALAAVACPMACGASAFDGSTYRGEGPTQVPFEII